MRTVWRIATDAPSYGADNLSRTRAKLTGGHRNEKDVTAVHAAGRCAPATRYE